MDLNPVFSIGILSLGAQAGYYGLLWLLGGRAERARAADGFERVVISSILFGIAVSMAMLISLGVGVFTHYLPNEVKNRMEIYKMFNVNDLNTFLSNIQVALERAMGVYRSYFDAAVASMLAFFGAVVGTGLLPWTQSISMAIVNVAMAVLTVFGSILVSSALYGVAAAMAVGWPALMPIGAVLLTYERTRNLGALLIAAGAVAPSVLAVGADLLNATTRPVVLTWEYFAGGGAWALWSLAQAMVTLGMTAVVMTALTYAVSRLFDHVGAHFAIE